MKMGVRKPSVKKSIDVDNQCTLIYNNIIRNRK